MQNTEKNEDIKVKTHECSCETDCGPNCACEHDHEEESKKEEIKNEEIPEAAEIVEEEVKEEKQDIEEKLKVEVEEWKGAYLRSQADFQNFTKRKEKEIDELRKFSSEKIITKFLGSLDNLERAMEASTESKDFDSLLKGIEMITRSLKDIINSEGVEEIKAEGIYDPVYHHAVSIENTDEYKEDEIVRVLQKGYIMKGKVIRPAMVTVCKK